jgi:hypothetical protein
MAACCALCTHGVLTLLNDSLSALLSVVGGLRSVVVYMSAELHEPQVWPRQEKAAYDLIEGSCGKYR